MMFLNLEWPAMVLSLRQAEGRAIGFEQSVHLLPRMSFKAAQRYYPPHRLGVIAIGLGFRIDVANVVGDALLLLLKPFDPLDKQPQLVRCDNTLAHLQTPNPDDFERP